MIVLPAGIKVADFGYTKPGPEGWDLVDYACINSYSDKPRLYIYKHRSYSYHLGILKPPPEVVSLCFWA